MFSIEHTFDATIVTLVDEGAGHLQEDIIVAPDQRLKIDGPEVEYLFNQEVKDVYYDPEDLSRHYFKIPGIDLPPCRYCGAIGWDFSSTPPDQAAV